MVSLVEKRQAVQYLEEQYPVSERRACHVISLSRSTKRREPGTPFNVALVSRVHELSERYPRSGYRKIHWKLQEEEWRACREHVRLIRKRDGLQVPRKQKKRRALGMSTSASSPALFPNHVWSYDFVLDRTEDGRRIRCLTVIDEFTRRGLAIECGRHMTSGDVIRVLSRLVECHGSPSIIKSDNGPEFVASSVQDWIKEAGIKTRYIDPGSPWQNGHNESFNGIFRDGCLNRWLFYSVREAKMIIQQWLEEYNEERPHGSLQGATPAAYSAACNPLGSSVAA